jgi:hypothetical protein
VESQNYLPIFSKISQLLLLRQFHEYREKKLRICRVFCTSCCIFLNFTHQNLKSQQTANGTLAVTTQSPTVFDSAVNKVSHPRKITAKLSFILFNLCGFLYLLEGQMAASIPRIN